MGIAAPDCEQVPPAGEETENSIDPEGSAEATCTPDLLINDYVVFLMRGDSLSASLNDGNAVAAVTDESCNALRFEAGGASNRPTFQANEVNGHSAIQFDGMNDYLATPDPGISFAQGTTMFAVLRFGAVNAAKLILDKQGSGADGFYFGLNGSAGFELVFGSGGINAPDTVDTTQFHIVTFVGNPTGGTFQGLGTGVSQVVFRDGQWTNASWTPYSPVDNTWDITVGANHWAGGTNLFLNATLAEMALYNRSLTDAERKQMECAYRSKYGVSLSYTCP